MADRTDRQSTPADPGEQADYSGLAKKLKSPVNDGAGGDAGASGDSKDEQVS